MNNPHQRWLDSLGLKPIPQRIMEELLASAGPDFPLARVTLDTIAIQCGISRRTVLRHLKLLKRYVVKCNRGLYRVKGRHA